MSNFVKFFILGGILSLAELLVFYLFVELGVFYVTSNVICFVLFSFIGVFIYKHFIFKGSTKKLREEIFLTYLINIVGLIINTLFLMLFIHIGLDVLISKILATFISAIYGYFGRKIFIYKGVKNV